MHDDDDILGRIRGPEDITPDMSDGILGRAEREGDEFTRWMAQRGRLMDQTESSHQAAERMGLPEGYLKFCESTAIAILTAPHAAPGLVHVAFRLGYEWAMEHGDDHSSEAVAAAEDILRGGDNNGA